MPFFFFFAMVGDMAQLLPVCQEALELIEAPVRDEDGTLVPLEPLRDEQIPVWKRCLESQTQPRMLRALRLILAGFSYKEAKVMLGYDSPAPIFAAAARFGVAGMTHRLLSLQRANTHLALEQIGDQLLNPDEPLKLKEIAIVAGIGHDKVLKAEQQEKSDQQLQTFAGLFANLVEKLGSGGTRQLEEPETIDVTPERETE